MLKMQGPPAITQSHMDPIACQISYVGDSDNRFSLKVMTTWPPQKLLPERLKNLYSKMTFI